MNRRGFIGLLGAFAGSAVLDPERLLWRRGEKLISIPKPQDLRLGLRSLYNPYTYSMRIMVKMEDGSWKDIAEVCDCLAANARRKTEEQADQLLNGTIEGFSAPARFK